MPQTLTSAWFAAMSLIYSICRLRPERRDGIFGALRGIPSLLIALSANAKICTESRPTAQRQSSAAADEVEISQQPA